MSLSSACSWCATSNPRLGYRGGVKGDLCAGSVPQSRQGKAWSECSHRWVWMRKKDLQLLLITWLRSSLAGGSCVEGDTVLRPLRQSHLERQWVFGRPTPKSGSEFDTSCVCSDKIYVLPDKGIWKSVMALEAPTGLNGPDKPYLGPCCPWPRAPFQPLGLSVPALVVLQQCWSPALYGPLELGPCPGLSLW